jgi:polyhydroxyalkanoate synthase subunit PhaC
MLDDQDAVHVMQNQVFPDFSSGLRWCFETMDRSRRQRGALLDSLGFRPQTTAGVTLLETDELLLHAFGEASPGRPLALIVPAPIKRAYIWDLNPECSVVRHALQAGMQVCLIEWKDPDTNLGLEDYGHRLLAQCVAAIVAQGTVAPPFLFAHSLGGVFAGVYAALEPERVAGLVLVETPLHFAEASGDFRNLLAAAPPAREVTRRFGNVPGSVLNAASMAASPSTFAFERHADLLASLGSQEKLRLHLQVERWTLDEAPMAPLLFEQVVEHLYREDRFYRGALTIGGRSIGPGDVRCPLLSVYDPRSRIIPPEAVIAFHEAAASFNKRLLAYQGDIGVALAHVGALVGERAHRELWPMIFEWTTGIFEAETVPPA